MAFRINRGTFKFRDEATGVYKPKFKIDETSGKFVELDDAGNVAAETITTAGGTITGAFHTTHTSNTYTGASATLGSYYINNSQTRLHEGGGNSLKITTPTGYLELGSMNSGFSHIQADRDLYIYPGARTNIIHLDGHVRPYTDGTSTLGSTTRRWNGVYGTSGDFSGNLVVGGTITAQEFHTEFVNQTVIREDGDVQIDGDLFFSGSATTTNQARAIYFSGYDKEGTTDFSDKAYIMHTTNTGGHGGSVLVISSRNDSNDGIAFDTNGNSQLKHNGSVIWTAGNDGAGSGLDADKLDGQEGSYYAPASHSHNLWDLPLRRSGVNVDNVGSDNIFSTTRTTGTSQGTWPSAYMYLVSFGDRSAGIQFAKGFGSDTSLYYRGGTDNSSSENGANTYNNWRRFWNSTDFSSTNVANWNTAYGWGNHASAGYLTTTGKAADSNLLDGINSTGFVRYDGRLAANADTVNYTSVKVWDVSQATDDPSGAADGLLTTKYWDSSDWAVQSYHDFHTNRFHLRSKQSGTWQSAWSEVWTTDNFNPASYLTTSGKAADSNLLDGINSTQFLRNDLATNQVLTQQLSLRAHSNGWEGGLRLVSNDGAQNFQLHPDNNGNMYVDRQWYFSTGIKIGTLSGGHLEPYGDSMNVRKVNSISFAPNNGWNDPTYHGIMSTDHTGTASDSISINSYNDITLRLDSNSNNGGSYLRIMNNTTGSNTGSWFGYNGTIWKNRLWGNVGIDTEPRDDSYRLALGGSVHMGNANIHYTNEVHFNSGTRFINEGNNYLRFRSDSTTSGGIKLYDGGNSLKGYGMYWDGSGNGVLNSAGSWGLRLAPGNSSTYLYHSGSEKLSTTSSGIQVTGTGRFGAHAVIGTDVAGGYYQDSTNGAYRAIGTSGDIGYYFQTNNGANTRMYVGLSGTYGGRVGIGTTSPARELHVIGSIRSSSWLRVDGTAGLYFETYGGGWYMTDDTYVRAYNDKRIYTASTSRWAIHTAGGMDAVGDMHAARFVDRNDTGYYLDPNATSRLRRIDLIASGAGWNDGLNLYSSDGSNRWNLLVDNGQSDNLRIAYNNSERVRFEAGSNVQVYGNTNVYGLVYASNYIHSNGEIYADGSIHVNRDGDSGDYLRLYHNRITRTNGSPITVENALDVVSTTAGSDVLAVDGVNGRLFTVTDDLTDSLFSVNTIAGLPIIEAFADQSIKLGPFTAPVEVTSTGELKVDGGTDLGTAITGATVSNDTITFTRANGGTFAVTTSDANTNYYLSGAAFNTNDGVLTLTVTGGTDQTVDLDGRYLTKGTNVAIDGNLVLGNGSYGSNNSYGGAAGKLMFRGSNADSEGNYYIGTNLEDYGGNYSKLDLRWHTGIRMGAQASYGGIRFYDNEDLGTRIMSIGETDTNVRIDNNLWIGGAGGWITDLLNGKETAGAAAAITLATLGYTGATNANYITNNNQLTNGAGYVTSSGNTTIGIDYDINTSGATIVDNIYVTDGVITSMGTRVLTLADLGYTGATNANYITNNNQLINGRGYVTSSHTHSEYLPVSGGVLTGPIYVDSGILIAKGPTVSTIRIGTSGTASNLTSTSGQSVYIGDKAGNKMGIDSVTNFDTSYNVMIGDYAGYNVSVGRQNTFLGASAGYGVFNGTFGPSGSTYVGYRSGYRINNNVDNTAVGSYSGEGASSGYTGGYNTSVGTKSLKSLTTGSRNVAIGNLSHTNSTTVDESVGIGYGAGWQNNGQKNIIIGGWANGTSETTQIRSTAIGSYAKAIADNSIAIGASAEALEVGELAIGSSSYRVGNVASNGGAVPGTTHQMEVTINGQKFLLHLTAI